MEYQGVAIVCPACRSELGAAAAALRCTACGREYPVLEGIPDLRLWPDPYIGIEEDRAKAQKFARECRGLGFADSVELYYRLTTVVPPFQAKAFTRALLAAAERARHSLDTWERVAGAMDTRELRLLDLGCGTAPVLAAAAGRYRSLTGVDIAFRWLIMAKKRLEEDGIEAPLVCACAEALPFPDAMFDRVVADSTLEHLRDVQLGLRECQRVLAPRGRLFAATPNRWSPGPDPHAGIWAGGWLPERVIARYVKARGGIPPVRRLLSARDLRALSRAAGFEAPRVFVPAVPKAQRDGFSSALRRIIDLYNTTAGTAPGRAVLLRIGPLLHMTAAKPARAGAVTPAAATQTAPDTRA